MVNNNNNLNAAISSCQSGDRESFGLVYDQFVRRIYRYFYYRCRDRESSEDLTSITFIKAYENINSFDNSRGEFSSWLYRIARNTLIDHFRFQKSFENLDDCWDLGREENLAAAVDDRERLAQVRLYLDGLPKDQRDLVIMRIWDELTYQEISMITGRTAGALKVSVSRILSRLRTQFSAAIAVLISLIFV